MRHIYSLVPSKFLPLDQEMKLNILSSQKETDKIITPYIFSLCFQIDAKLKYSELNISKHSLKKISIA
jgi:hypothetical protein